MNIVQTYHNLQEGMANLKLDQYRDYKIDNGCKPCYSRDEYSDLCFSKEAVSTRDKISLRKLDSVGEFFRKGSHRVRFMNPLIVFVSDHYTISSGSSLLKSIMDYHGLHESWKDSDELHNLIRCAITVLYNEGTESGFHRLYVRSFGKDFDARLPFLESLEDIRFVRFLRDYGYAKSTIPVNVQRNLLTVLCNALNKYTKSKYELPRSPYNLSNPRCCLVI